MTIYGLTADGFVLKPFAVIRQEVEDYQLLHIDAGLDFSDQSSISQNTIPLANQIAELWQLAQAVDAAFTADRSNDFSLVEVAALTGTTVTPYSKTTVVGQVNLNPDKSLAVGSVANITSRPNTRFLTTVEVPADPLGRVLFDVEFEAEDSGPIEVGIGQLNEIAEPQNGWTAVTNAVVGIPGSEPETDDELRLKRETELRSSGSANLDSILAAVSQVSGVVGVAGSENVLNRIVDGMPPNSVSITVRGGSDADVAQAIFTAKSAGIGTVGTTHVAVTDSQNESQDIYLIRSTALDFYATMSIEVTTDWDVTPDKADIKTRIAAYVNALSSGGDVIYDQIKCKTLDNGHVYKITSLQIDFAPAPSSTVDLAVAVTNYALSDVANISITVV